MTARNISMTPRYADEVEDPVAVVNQTLLSAALEEADAHQQQAAIVKTRISISARHHTRRIQEIIRRSELMVEIRSPLAQLLDISEN